MAQVRTPLRDVPDYLVLKIVSEPSGHCDSLYTHLSGIVTKRA